MIAVIADDLTGAAELGGIGLRYGLKTEIHLAVPESTGADLLVIAADSRSKGEAAAVEEMLSITRRLRNLRPEWIYKKTDSVLRGHVIAELKAQLQALDIQSALLVPGNPALGRTISAGRYYLNDQPIHHSAFSMDPEFPIRSHDVQDMLRTRQRPVPVKRPEEDLPVRGIVLGEVRDGEDLQRWARSVPRRMLAAGASGFFRALLEVRVPGVGESRVAQSGIGSSVGESGDAAAVVGEPVSWGSPLLFVSGSTFDSSRASIRQRLAEGGPVFYLPKVSDRCWEEKVVTLLRAQGKAIVAIDPEWHDRSAVELRELMAIAVDRLLRMVLPAELIIEGGATAYALFAVTGWRAFIPVGEPAPGVIRMRVPELPGIFITVKPGSYRWPGIPL